VREIAVTPNTPAPSVDRFDSDRGSLIPEFALAAPILIFMMLAIFEFGMGYRERINTEAAVRSAARQASNLGDTRPADYEALVGFQSVMSRAKHITINRVVIYKATGASGAPSVASCLTAPATATGTGVNNACNIYSNTQLQSLGSPYTVHFGTTDTACAGSAWDRFWCPPTMRNADQGDAGGLDYLGVYANLSYQSYTRLIPGTITMTDRAVMRLEPKV
jgi:Flp pilus assembly protein TadG